MRTGESRSAAEHQAERTDISRYNGGERLDDIPVFFDEGGAR